MPGLPIVGHWLSYRLDPLGFVVRLARDHEIVHFKLGRRNAYLLNRPDYIKEVLVTQQDRFNKGAVARLSRPFVGDGLLTSEGSLHRRHRRLAQPAFRRDRIAPLATSVTDHAVWMRTSWREGATVDIAWEMTRLTLPIVGRLLCDMEIDATDDELGRSLLAAWELSNATLVPWFDLRRRIPLSRAHRFLRVRDGLDRAAYPFIAERRAAPGGDDLLALLMRGHRTDGGEVISDRLLRDELVTTLLAGHETVALGLAWAWYLLAQHPDVEARLYEEVDAVLEGRLATPDDFPRLEYTRMVFAEALRLYPPLWALIRRSLADVRVGPYLIPRDSTVIVSQFLTHRDPRYFPDPSRFDPLRWTRERQASRPSFAYFPFGGGIRRCLGDQIAWMEGVMILATLAQAWRLRIVPGQPIKLRARLTLRPKHGIRMILERRGASTG